MRENIADMDLEKVLPPSALLPLNCLQVGLLLRDWKRGDFVFPVTSSQVRIPPSQTFRHMSRSFSTGPRCLLLRMRC
jgi:hypothetical protein